MKQFTIKVLSYKNSYHFLELGQSSGVKRLLEAGLIHVSILPRKSLKTPGGKKKHIKAERLGVRRVWQGSCKPSTGEAEPGDHEYETIEQVPD